MPATEIRFDNWDNFIHAVMDKVMELRNFWNSESSVMFFRGHSSSSYVLEPGLFRNRNGVSYTPYNESNFYYEFRARAGNLLKPHFNSWEILFTMQHFRLPTRLLDWSETFSVALYFALEGAQGDIDIWMFDPYELNQLTRGIDEVLDVEADLKASYFDYFVERTVTPDWGDLIAIYPRRHNERLSSQSGMFTLHNERTRLDDLSLTRLYRFTLEQKCLDDARNFLYLAGVNDFSLFPDLEGLGTLLKKRFSGQTRQKG